MINLKSSDIKKIKQKILEEQEYRCAICGKPLTLEEACLDHQHKYRKTDVNGVNGNGLVRGVLCREDNCLEGKIFNNSARFLKQPTNEQRIEWLEKLIEYYKKEPYPYVHPSEVEKPKQLSKRNFNKLNKLCDGKLEFPKSGKMTKQLQKLYEKFNIEPYN